MKEAWTRVRATKIVEKVQEKETAAFGKNTGTLRHGAWRLQCEEEQGCPKGREVMEAVGLSSVQKGKQVRAGHQSIITVDKGSKARRMDEP